MENRMLTRYPVILLMIIGMAAIGVFACAESDSSDAGATVDGVIYNELDEEERTAHVIGFEEGATSITIHTHVTFDTDQFTVVQIDATLKDRVIDNLTINFTGDIESGTFVNLTSSAKNSVLNISDAGSIKAGAFENCGFTSIYCNAKGVHDGAFKDFPNLTSAEFGPDIEFDEDSPAPFDGCASLFTAYCRTDAAVSDKDGHKMACFQIQDRTVETDAALNDDKSQITLPLIEGLMGTWNGNQYQDGQKVPFDNSLTFTLDANLSKLKYTVAYDPNGGTGQLVSEEVYFDATFNLKLIKDIGFTKEGYNFTGWNTKEDGSGTGFYDGQSVSALAKRNTVTLYAQWSQNSYVIWFDANCSDYEGRMATQVLEFGKEDNLRPIGYARSGYMFQGWATEKNGPVAYLDMEKVLNLTTGGLITLYAVWLPVSYMVTFDKNLEAASGEMLYMIFLYGVVSSLNANQFSAEGYSFIGWATEPDGKQIFADGASVSNLCDTPGGRITLYAKWAQVPVFRTVTFHANNGTEQSKVQTGEAGKDITLDENIFSWKEHNFAKWNTKQDGTGDSYTDKQTVALKDNIELYAQWDSSPNHDKIVFGALGAVLGLAIGILAVALIRRP